MAYPNRFVCTVLEEMREQLKKLDVHSLDRYKSIHAMMIEEAQSMVNRMEASLEDQRDVRKLTDKRHELRKEVRKLNKKVKELKEVLDGDTVDDDEINDSFFDELMSDLD